MEYAEARDAVSAWWKAHASEDDDCESCEHDELSYDFMADAAWSGLETAVWSSSNDEGDGTLYGDGWEVDDIDREVGVEFAREVADFCHAMCREVADMDPGQVGHDFVLTRNREGAGFWDRGLGELGDRLTEMSHPFGGFNLYVGDDGKVYAHG